MAIPHQQISREITVFHGQKAPEPGILVGYGAVIEAYQLPVPLPANLALISKKRRSYTVNGWQVLSSKYAFEDTLYKHLLFSFKYEGIDLLFFKKLFDKLSEHQVVNLLQIEPTGQYSRKIWFLYEWLMGKQLNLPDLTFKNFVPLLDEKQQYAVQGTRSQRHRIINNLPGTRDFCPLVFKTEKLEEYRNKQLSEQQTNSLQHVHKDILQRAASFLLLQDSRASFTIEGESPNGKRATRWAKALGQAGKNPLSKEELLRLQQVIIEDTRFLNMGFRQTGGFVGEHDRSTGEPLPEHVSAKAEDLDQLINGLIHESHLLEDSDFDAVIAAAMVAFGFVFIHSFEDGNGRIHRYLIHHILARKNVSPQGMVFPVSASILNHIDDYRKVLQSFSHPLLDLIDWRTTADNNIEVLNDTIDYYRYFDATPQAEFLYDCVDDTIQNIIPQEVDYLQRYDEMKRYLDDYFEMPDKTVALLIRFLEQNNGRLSRRAREKEFSALTPDEVTEIEQKYKEVFL